MPFHVGACILIRAAIEWLVEGERGQLCHVERVCESESRGGDTSGAKDRSIGRVESVNECLEACRRELNQW